MNKNKTCNDASRSRSSFRMKFIDHEVNPNASFEMNSRMSEQRKYGTEYGLHLQSESRVPQYLSWSTKSVLQEKTNGVVIRPMEAGLFLLATYLNFKSLQAKVNMVMVSSQDLLTVTRLCREVCAEAFKISQTNLGSVASKLPLQD